MNMAFPGRKKIAGYVFLSLLILIFVSFIDSSSNAVFAEDAIKGKIAVPDKFDFAAAVKAHYQSEENYLKFVKFTPDDDDAYGLALTNLTLGLLKKEPFFISNARSFFRIGQESGETIRERKVAVEGARYADNLLTGGFRTSTEKTAFRPVSIEIKKPRTGNYRKIIIGKSAIRISKGAKIKTQVDRVTRDWLSAYAMNNTPWNLTKEKLVPWHEGEKVREILGIVDARVATVWGTKAKNIGGKWYAPDADGIFRFRISEDKIYNYPTNIIVDQETVIINDTHGINTIAWDSLDANLVIGCGDLDGKMEAAYYLAGKGIDVYMPTDRFISMLIGTSTKGTIIGSAPVKKTKDGAIIGDQPLSIDIDEPIMVTNATGGYPLQYYDAPYLYFRSLEKYIGRSLKITPVQIEEYGKAYRIVDLARKANINLIGMRVASKEEYDSVSKWLRDDKSHRAILFHSAVYPEGYRLFFEFPAQTTFGDIHISFE